MRRSPLTSLCLGFFLVVALARITESADPPAADAPSPKVEEAADDRLMMTPAIACRSIDGYENYETLPDAALTSDEKLLVYYRPRNYRIEQVDGNYHGHMTQDGQIRKRGEKAVLQRKEKLLDYEFKMATRPSPVYLKNTISLKGLKPGDYDFDIILHDQVAQGPPVKQTLAFKVVAAAVPKAESEAETTEAPSKTRAKRKPSGRTP